ncbi:MAG: serine/threonine protein kinase, partial [Propionibacteriaceae bacterium]|nr:serine/threonine protein kinase [Propionibacteriaceae bacterium]
MSDTKVGPRIEGLTCQKWLGSGGFADVYLYQSDILERSVAVKVLRTTDLSQKLIDRFQREARTMAQLEHPYIVHVFDFGWTDGGSPYIEMAYMTGESLADEVKRGPLKVSEVLRYGISLACAVETAHRAADPLLHRDIKPANILTNHYGDPALTDFGIASRLREDDDDDASLSVPWAPPEMMFGWTRPDFRSDVYSLAATLWHLLVGRTPFEIPGGDNDHETMMDRARNLDPPPTGRGDVPASLERLLRSALSRDPNHRPQTAVTFARALQNIESELHLPSLTPLKLMGSAERAPRSPAVAQRGADGPDEDRTHRQSAPQVIHAQAPAPPPLGATVRRADSGQTGAPAAADIPAPPAPAEPMPLDGGSPVFRRCRVGLVVWLVAAAALIGVGVWRITLAFEPDQPGGGQSFAEVPPDAGLGAPPGDVTVHGQRDGEAVSFTWTYDYSRSDDTYQLLRPDGVTVPVYEAAWADEAAGPEPYCVQVKVVRAD